MEMLRAGKGVTPKMCCVLIIIIINTAHIHFSHYKYICIRIESKMYNTFDLGIHKFLMYSSIPKVRDFIMRIVSLQPIGTDLCCI